jgi:hypothetical protein
MINGRRVMGRECRIQRIKRRSNVQSFGGKHEGKIPARTPRHRLQDNIKIDPKPGRESVGWIHLAQDRDLWLASVNLPVP